jgi:hypothetical protein
VVQLDIGYLAVLFQHIDLGRSGLVRLLQDDGQERLRIDNSGVVVAGQTLVPGCQVAARSPASSPSTASTAPSRACTGACPSAVSA